MDPKTKLKAVLADAAALEAKAKDGTITDEELTEFEALAKEAGELQDRIEKTASVSERFKQLGAGQAAAESEADQVDGASIGERFVKSAEYRGFREAHPHGVGKETPISISAKAIGSRRTLTKVDPAPLGTGTTGNAAPVRIPDVVDLVYRPERRLLDLITVGVTGLPWFQYRQVVSKTNNAAIVPEAKGTTGSTVADGLKPLSTLTTQAADAKAHTYADGMEVTNQELTDDGIIQTLIDSTLKENLEIRIEDILLNGEGTADEPAGILNTTGVLQQTFATDMPTSIRKSITKLQQTSGAPIQAVVLNPEDDEAWDLLKDANNRYLGNGPFGAGPSTAWGYVRSQTPAIPKGKALVGNFKQVQLLILEALSVLAFNQHKDYAQRNLSYIRAELRATQLIRVPAQLCLVDLEAAA